MLGSGTEARVGEIHIRRSSASRQWQRAPRAYSTKPRRPKNGWRWVAKKVTSTWMRTAKCMENPRGPHTTTSGTGAKLLVRPSELRLPHLPPWRTWRSIKRLQNVLRERPGPKGGKHYRLIPQNIPLCRGQPSWSGWGGEEAQ